MGRLRARACTGTLAERHGTAMPSTPNSPARRARALRPSNRSCGSQPSTRASRCDGGRRRVRPPFPRLLAGHAAPTTRHPSPASQTAAYTLYASQTRSLSSRLDSSRPAGTVRAVPRNVPDAAGRFARCQPGLTALCRHDETIVACAWVVQRPHSCTRTRGHAPSDILLLATPCPSSTEEDWGRLGEERGGALFVNCVGYGQTSDARRETRYGRRDRDAALLRGRIVVRMLVYMRPSRLTQYTVLSQQYNED